MKKQVIDFVSSAEPMRFLCQQIEDEIHILCTNKYNKVIINVTDGPKYEIELNS